MSSAVTTTVASAAALALAAIAPSTAFQVGARGEEGCSTVGSVHYRGQVTVQYTSAGAGTRQYSSRPRAVQSALSLPQVVTFTAFSLVPRFIFPPPCVLQAMVAKFGLASICGYQTVLGEKGGRGAGRGEWERGPFNLEETRGKPGG